MGKKSRKHREPAHPPEPPVGAGSGVTPFWRREGAQVAGLVLLAFALRLWNLLEARAHDPYFFHPSVDPLIYHEWAQRIAGGALLADHPFHMGPLYPYFLGGVYSLFGTSLLAARLVQMAIGLGSLLLVYRLARRIFGRRAALLTGLLTALYPMYIFYEGLLLLAVLAVFLNLCCANLLVAARTRPTLVRWIFAGVFLGLSALARPNALLLGPVLVVWMLFELRRKQGLAWKRTLLHVAGFGFGAALAISPATLHNYVVGGDFVLITTTGGPNFYIGNRAEADGTWKLPERFSAASADNPGSLGVVFRRIAEEETGRELRISEVSRFWTKKALADVREDPLRWAGLMVRKLGLLLNHHELPGNRNYYSARRYSAPLRLPLPSTGAILPIALLGLLLAFPLRREAFPLYAFVVVYAVALVLYFLLSRFRMPVMPFFMVFAGFALHRLGRMLGSWHLKAVLLSVAALVAGFGVVGLDLTAPPALTYMHHFNLGNAHRTAGRYEESIREFRRAVQMNPTHLAGHNNLAMVLERSPETRDRAVVHWMKVRELAKEVGERKFIDRANKHLEQLRRHGYR